VHARLEDAGLASYFAVVSCRDDRLAAKPEPDLYLDACRRLSVEPTRAIAVEDSANGLQAAHAAGLVCVAVPNSVTRGHDLSAAELLVESLAAVPIEDAVKRLSEKTAL
jgi:beta-phosphoglucomutase-like phosphatase (HAD superfamily)